LELVVEDGQLVDSGVAGEVDGLDEAFFSEAPHSFPPQEIWGDELNRAPRRSRGSRFAQYTTFVMMAVFLVGIGSYTFYTRVVMPTPVEVGLAGSALQSPFPDAAPSQPPSAQLSGFRTAAGKQPATEELTALDSAAASAEPAAESAPPPAVEAQDQNEAAAIAAVAAVPAVTQPAQEAPVPAAEAVPVKASPAPVAEAPASTKSVRRPARATRPATTRAAKQGPRTARRAAARRARGRRGDSQPDRADVLRKMAYHYLNEGRHREAERYASQAVGADPRNSQGWILLGLARDALQDREGAKSAFNRCTQAEGPYVSECRRLRGGYM
jgi:hypothetical protein